MLDRKEIAKAVYEEADTFACDDLDDDMDVPNTYCDITDLACEFNDWEDTSTEKIAFRMVKKALKKMNRDIGDMVYLSELSAFKKSLKEVSKL